MLRLGGCKSDGSGSQAAAQQARSKNIQQTLLFQTTRQCAVLCEFASKSTWRKYVPVPSDPVLLLSCHRKTVARHIYRFRSKKMSTRFPHQSARPDLNNTLRENCVTSAPDDLLQILMCHLGQGLRIRRHPEQLLRHQVNLNGAVCDRSNVKDEPIIHRIAKHEYESPLPWTNASGVKRSLTRRATSCLNSKASDAP